MQKCYFLVLVLKLFWLHLLCCWPARQALNDVWLAQGLLTSVNHKKDGSQKGQRQNFKQSSVRMYKAYLIHTCRANLCKGSISPVLTQTHSSCCTRWLEFHTLPVGGTWLLTEDPHGQLMARRAICVLRLSSRYTKVTTQIHARWR